MRLPLLFLVGLFTFGTVRAGDVSDLAGYVLKKSWQISVGAKFLIAY